MADQSDFTREIELLREVESLLADKYDPAEPRRDIGPLLRKTRELLERLGEEQEFWRGIDERYGR